MTGQLVEIRDPKAALRLLEQSIWLARSVPIHADSVERAVRWAMEIAATGDPLPPLGFVLDVGHVALHLDHVGEAPKQALPDVDAADVRKYEDYVLGKFYADVSFQRAADALATYLGRDRDRGLAYLVRQLRERAGIGGFLVSPAVAKTLVEQPVDEILVAGWDVVEQHGFASELSAAWEEITQRTRITGELLGAEDVFELESGIAIADFAQRVALRQILQAAAHLSAELPAYRPHSVSQHAQVATNIIEEDTYPIGGYTSISNRGSIESLLHSQLAYMERNERPDLFDVKFLRDELFYYSRDENQFLRRRRTIIFVFHADLLDARFKDREAPWQRIVLLTALTVAIQKKLSDWLSDEALVFEFIFLRDGDSADLQLEAERTLLETIYRDPIEAGGVVVDAARPHQLTARCADRARRSLCHLLSMSFNEPGFESDRAVGARLQVCDPHPLFEISDLLLVADEEDSIIDSWRGGLLRLLEEWL